VEGRAFLFFTSGCKTSDFIADGLTLWWRERKGELSRIRNIVINMDNGPECNGHRSQFLLRMTEFARDTGLNVRIVYYPPYHSKYNAIERYWAGLEKSWNGHLPGTVDVVMNRAANFVWKGIRASVKLLDAIYEKGIRVIGKARKKLEQCLFRSETLPSYDITFRP
jgi:hypothetical protein